MTVSIGRCRSETLAVTNLLKALRHLRQHPRMSKRFVVSEEETARALRRGDRAVTLGVLEDCHRLAENAPPRPIRHRPVLSLLLGLGPTKGRKFHVQFN